MGSFSWCTLDTRQELILGQQFKVLIPEEFGGGVITTEYEDYGRFYHNGNEYDLYEILAAWNGAGIDVDEEGLVISTDDTDTNRILGINMGCYENEHASLKYPLRLVSILDDKTYEDYSGMFSIGAPSQGWDPETVYDEELFYRSRYIKD